MESSSVDGKLIELRGASRTYGTGEASVLAVYSVDMVIKRKEQVALVGPSGAGKSTLLSLLGLLDRPTSGSVMFAGTDVGSLGDDARADIRRDKIGLVFQLFHLVPALSALENVMLPLVPYRSRTQLRVRAVDLLTSFGLADRMTHYPGELSGGEQQRVAIARALIAEPEVILADEPTGNLDSRTAAQVIELLLRLQRERSFALVVATHDLAFAARLGRTVSLLDGRQVD